MRIVARIKLKRSYAEEDVTNAAVKTQRLPQARPRFYLFMSLVAIGIVIRLDWLGL